MDARQALFRIFLLLCPLFIWEVSEIFMLPSDLFTFRAWEALTVQNLQAALPGPFYPNAQIRKFEAGDRQPHAQRTKWVEVVTDPYGYRNRPEIAFRRPDIVVVGDSNIFGSHVDQKNILSEVMMSLCNCTVYNYGSGGLVAQVFLNDFRFFKNKPEVLVHEMRRDDIILGNFAPYKQCLRDVEMSSLASRNCLSDDESPASVRWIRRNLSSVWQVRWDRFKKQNFYHFLASRIFSSPPPGPRPQPVMAQIDPASAAKKTEETIESAFRSIKSYDDEAKKRGFRYILFFMPSRYRDLDPLIPKLNAAGVETIGFLPNSRQVHGYDSETWTLTDDNHWNENSIRYSAQLILDKINERARRLQ